MNVSPFPHRAPATLILTALLTCRAMAGSTFVPASDLTAPSELHESRPGAWRFSAGYLWRQVGTLRWQSRSSITPGTIPFLLPSGRNRPSSAGGTSPLDSHNYEDGYVRPDMGTIRDGDTWNWGYKEDSQIEGRILTYHSAYSMATSGKLERASANKDFEDDLESNGFSLALDSPGIVLGKETWLGLTLGYNLVREDTTRNTQGYAARQTSSSSDTRLTDRYDTGGIIPPLAPYQGSLQGPGPLINAHPVRSTSTSTRSDEARLSSRIEQTLELDLHTLSLGPVIHWQPAPSLVLNVSTGLAVNFASYDVSQTETLTVARTTRSAGNRGQERSSTLSTSKYNDSGTKVLPGIYLAGTTQVLLSANWSLFATGRYDWSDDLKFRTGPSHGSLDLQGWSVQAGLAYGF